VPLRGRAGRPFWQRDARSGAADAKPPVGLN
jgi:hypothetical protein